MRKLRAGTYDGARRKEARAQVATDGLSNLEVVTKIWVLVAHVMALCTSVGAVLPDSHWTTFIVYHLTATSLWMPDVDGLQRQGLRARAEQIARGKDNRDESVQVNYASAAVTVGWAAMASGAPDDGGTGVHNCTLHGPNSNHTTDDCNELKRRANGGKKTASPRGDSDDGKCRECGKTGHKKINCPKIKCRDCGQRGHIARKCSEPKAQSAAAADQASLVAAMRQVIDKKWQSAGVIDPDSDSDSDSSADGSAHALMPSTSDDEDCAGTWGVGGL